MNINNITNKITLKILQKNVCIHPNPNPKSMR